jgi:hypothetical protein
MAAAPHVGFIRRMWTPQLEFEFFLDGLREIPAECRLVTVLLGMEASAL